MIISLEEIKKLPIKGLLSRLGFSCDLSGAQLVKGAKFGILHWGFIVHRPFEGMVFS